MKEQPTSLWNKTASTSAQIFPSIDASRQHLEGQIASTYKAPPHSVDTLGHGVDVLSLPAQVLNSWMQSSSSDTMSLLSYNLKLHSGILALFRWIGQQLTNGSTSFSSYSNTNLEPCTACNRNTWQAPGSHSYYGRNRFSCYKLVTVRLFTPTLQMWVVNICAPITIQ